jgi:hypothetical protein
VVDNTLKYMFLLSIVQKSIKSIKRISDAAQEFNNKLERFKEKGKFLPKENPIYQTKSSIETLKELEYKFDGFELDLMYAVPKIDINTSKVSPLFDNYIFNLLKMTECSKKKNN